MTRRQFIQLAGAANSISMCRNRSGAGSVHGRRSAVKLACRRTRRRGRDGLWCRAASRSNVAAAVHPAVAGQPDRSVCAGHIHPGGRAGGTGGCVTA